MFFPSGSEAGMDLLFQVVKLFLFFSNEELKAAFSMQNLGGFFLLLLTSPHFQRLQFAYFSTRGGEVAIVSEGVGEDFCMKLLENCTGK